MPPVPTRLSPRSFSPHLRQLLLDTWRRYWPVLAATVVLIPHALMFDFVNDDAYISFRYARNLAEHGQLVFNLGERVEGFTNFLWTVLLAGGIQLGISPVHLLALSGRGLRHRHPGGRWCGCRCGWTASGPRPGTPWPRWGWRPPAPSPAGAPAAWRRSCSPSWRCWASSGRWPRWPRRRGFASGVFFALAAMTRPEGMFLFGLAGAVPAAAQPAASSGAGGPQLRRARLSSRPSWPCSSPTYVWRWRVLRLAVPQHLLREVRRAAPAPGGWGCITCAASSRTTAWSSCIRWSLAGWLLTCAARIGAARSVRAVARW